MLHFFEKTKGTVTIFLVIILIPVIAVCTIFVDVSRIKLAQGLAISSSTLALNTVLTQYDEELSDYYGLIASCQNVDEYYCIAQDYFVDCMVSQGLSVTLAQEFATDITDIVKGNANINDFIAIDTEKTSATITAAENANLANPVMMKEEIVEFMKYRAPIELVGALGDDENGFVNKLLSVQEHIENMPIETRLQKEKNDYYMAESKLMEKALEVFEALKDYETFLPDDATDGKFDKKYLEETVKTAMGATSTEGSLEGLIKDYKELHRKYVSNWANTKGRQQFTSVETRVGNANISCSNTDVAALVVDSSIGNCKSKREAFISAQSALNTCIDGIAFAKANQSEVNKIQYWVQMEDQIVKGSSGDVYGNYTSALIDYLKAKEEMRVNFENRAPRIEKKTVTKTDPITGKTVTEEEEEEIDIAGDPYSGGGTIGEAYQAEAQINVSYTSDAIYSISKNMETYATDALKTSTPDNVVRSDAEAQIKDAVDAKIKDEYEALCNAQEKLQKISDMLPDLKELADDYDEKFDKWSSDAEENKDKSDITEQDYKETQKIKNPAYDDEDVNTNTALVRIDINGEDVDAFKDKLDSIIEALDSYRDAIESVKYRGNQVLGRAATTKTKYNKQGIYSFAQFESAAKGNNCTEPPVSIEDIPVMQADLDLYVESTWSIESDFALLKDIVENKTGNSPYLHDENWESDPEIAEFDAWLHQKFPNDEPTLEETKNILKKFKEMMKQIKETAASNFGEYSNTYLEDVEIKTAANSASLPSNGVDADTEQVFDEEEDDSEDSLSNTLDSSTNIGSLFEGINFTDLLYAGRDNLYTTEYIMDMFSYETSALEKLYTIQGGGQDNKDIYKMSDGNRISPGTAANYYNSLLDETPSESATWWNTKKSFTDNKTLTNKMINIENNISYGNEVEYILYGGENTDNDDKLETTLFFVRFAMNLGPILRVYWTNENLNNIANTIASITQGIIPAPLTKLIVVLGINAGESVVDRNYLKAGLPVAFFKNNPDKQMFIWIDLSDEDGFKEAVKSKNTEYAKTIMSTGDKISQSLISFSYSDYLYLFTFISLCASPDNIYKRTGDVIQATMAQGEGKDSFKLSNANTFFTIDTTVRVKPMMMTLPYATQSGVSVTDTDTWNTFSYKTAKGY